MLRAQTLTARGTVLAVLLATCLPLTPPQGAEPSGRSEGVAIKAGRLLASGDPRFGMPAQADLMARTLDDVQSPWMQAAIVAQFAHRAASGQ